MKYSIFIVFVTMLFTFPFSNIQAKTIKYDPNRKVNYTYCYSHEPQISLYPGDTVETKTYDAVNDIFQSTDKTLFPKLIIDETNPQTGPFYIEGAEAGDTLVVHIDKVKPNRSWGWGASIPYFGALAPEYKTAMVTDPAPDILFIWNFDFDRNVAILDTPNSKIKQIEVPLKPFLGTIGTVPPAKECIRSITPWIHGGNMDSNKLVEGTTMYFPVFEQGALLMLGDGHANQGDGEMGGSGIETSMDVRFTVDLIKGKSINWPRAETDEFIMSLGSTRPLIDAVRIACVDMVDWLTKDYGFDKWEAVQLIGQAVKLEIGNVVDPNYTVGCRIDKKYLK